jgi:hypothetical protein
MTDFETIIMVIVGFCAGLYIGWKAADTMHKMLVGAILKEAGVSSATLEKMADNAQKELDKLEGKEEDRIGLVIEQHLGQLYAFRKDNYQFVAQSSNKEELVKIIADRFKDTTFVVNKDDGAELLGLAKK